MTVFDEKNSAETLDTIFEGKLKLFQSRSGYRFSVDAILLARFATVRDGDKLADLGSGNGVIALILACLYPSLTATGVEAQASLVERAWRNIKLNGFEARVNMLRADVRAVRRELPPASFTVVVSNPPYRKPASGRVSPNAEKQSARHETRGALEDFLAAGAHLLRHKGRMALVYPALRAVDLLSAMRRAGIEPKRLRAVHSFAGKNEASLILVEGVKGGRGGLKVLPPLAIYQQVGRYTDEMAAVLAGERAIKTE